MPSKPTVYAWAPRYGTLFAAGGRLADRVYSWDLERESCAAQLRTGKRLLVACVWLKGASGRLCTSASWSPLSASSVLLIAAPAAAGFEGLSCPEPAVWLPPQMPARL